jgi:EAL domain-containing protein (putative c-di-GMP-specific phosphodiesterase class I)
MDDRLLAMETMVRLRLKGFRLSIDDFGTGYSSLLRLKQLPFTELKVDKSFVIGLHDSRDHAVIVRAIIQLARNLEMRSVVEGVEDEKALDFVAGLGCNEAQGYFIARPMAGPELSGFTKTWQWRQDSLRQKGNAAGLSAQDEVRDRRS